MFELLRHLLKIPLANVLREAIQEFEKNRIIIINMQLYFKNLQNPEGSKCQYFVASKGKRTPPPIAAGDAFRDIV